MACDVDGVDSCSVLRCGVARHSAQAQTGLRGKGEPALRIGREGGNRANNMCRNKNGAHGTQTLDLLPHDFLASGRNEDHQAGESCRDALDEPDAKDNLHFSLALHTQRM